jgi:inorganic pyrophosphatase
MLDLGPIKKEIPINSGIMPVAYGFITGTLQNDESARNPDEIPDEIDVLVYSKKDFGVGERITATPIGIMTREDGDHKVVAVDDTMSARIRKWEDIPSEERDLLTRYFGHKSPIISVGGARAAIDYIRKNRVESGD